MSQALCDLHLFELRLSMIDYRLKYGDYAADIKEIFAEALMKIENPDFSLALIKGENK